MGDALDLHALLRKKRDGGALSAAESAAFLNQAADGRATDAQCAAMLASAFHRGMTAHELAGWTKGMVATGRTLDLRRFGAPIVDKHSTGGIGDKASLPLAPALAALGCIVPMVSGRGLGHTGGTLDKLESIPGFSTAADPKRLMELLASARCAIVAQSATLVPADRRLYALRDEAELVEALPLVASSIVSKKLAEGLDALVLDVKFGSGAFFPDPARGAELARTMVALARDGGVKCTALLTAMGRPLGAAIGHSLEVYESLDCLAGRGPDDLRELVVRLGAELLVHVALAPDLAAGMQLVAGVLDDGRARQAFERMVAAQGGDVASLDGGLPATDDVDTFDAPHAGHLAWCDVRELGLAVRALGGGRHAAGDVIDPSVGLEVLVEEGTHVERGEPLLTVHHRAGRGLEEARAHIVAALTIGAEVAPMPLVSQRIE
jgi:pyrimidine-nucleoside phosphorylase